MLQLQARGALPHDVALLLRDGGVATAAVSADAATPSAGPIPAGFDSGDGMGGGVAGRSRSLSPSAVAGESGGEEDSSQEDVSVSGATDSKYPEGEDADVAGHVAATAPGEVPMAASHPPTPPSYAAETVSSWARRQSSTGTASRHALQSSPGSPSGRVPVPGRGAGFESAAAASGRAARATAPATWLHPGAVGLDHVHPIAGPAPARTLSRGSMWTSSGGGGGGGAGSGGTVASRTLTRPMVRNGSSTGGSAWEDASGTGGSVEVSHSGPPSAVTPATGTGSQSPGHGTRRPLPSADAQPPAGPRWLASVPSVGGGDDGGDGVGARLAARLLRVSAAGATHRAATAESAGPVSAAAPAALSRGGGETGSSPPQLPVPQQPTHTSQPAWTLQRDGSSGGVEDGPPSAAAAAPVSRQHLLPPPQPRRDAARAPSVSPGDDAVAPSAGPTTAVARGTLPSAVSALADGDLVPTQQAPQNPPGPAAPSSPSSPAAPPSPPHPLPLAALSIPPSPSTLRDATRAASQAAAAVAAVALSSQASQHRAAVAVGDAGGGGTGERGGGEDVDGGGSGLSNRAAPAAAPRTGRLSHLPQGASSHRAVPASSLIASSSAGSGAGESGDSGGDADPGSVRPHAHVHAFPPPGGASTSFTSMLASATAPARSATATLLSRLSPVRGGVSGAGVPSVAPVPPPSDSSRSPSPAAAATSAVSAAGLRGAAPSPSSSTDGSLAAERELRARAEADAAALRLAALAATEAATAATAEISELRAQLAAAEAARSSSATATAGEMAALTTRATALRQERDAAVATAQALRDLLDQHEGASREQQSALEAELATARERQAQAARTADAAVERAIVAEAAAAAAQAAAASAERSAAQDRVSRPAAAAVDDSVERLTAQLAVSSAECDALRGEVERRVGEVESLSRLVSEAQADARQAHEQREGLQARVAVLTAGRTSDAEALASLTSALAAQEAELRRLRSGADAHAAILAEARSQATAAVQAAEEATGQLEAARDECVRLRQEGERANAAATSAQAAWEAATADCNRMAEAIGDLQQQLRSVEGARDSLQATVTAQAQELAALHVATADGVTTTAALRAELAALQAEVADVTTRALRDHSEADTHRRAAEEARMQLQQQAADLARLQAAAAAADAGRTAAESHAADAVTRIAQLEHELEIARAECAAAAETLEHMSRAVTTAHQAQSAREAHWEGVVRAMDDARVHRETEHAEALRQAAADMASAVEPLQAQVQELQLAGRAAGTDNASLAQRYEEAVAALGAEKAHSAQLQAACAELQSTLTQLTDAAAAIPPPAATPAAYPTDVISEVAQLRDQLEAAAAAVRAIAVERDEAVATASELQSTLAELARSTEVALAAAADRETALQRDLHSAAVTAEAAAAAAERAEVHAHASQHALRLQATASLREPLIVLSPAPATLHLPPEASSPAPRHAPPAAASLSQTALTAGAAAAAARGRPVRKGAHLPTSPAPPTPAPAFEQDDGTVPAPAAAVGDVRWPVRTLGPALRTASNSDSRTPGASLSPPTSSPHSPTHRIARVVIDDAYHASRISAARSATSPPSSVDGEGEGEVEGAVGDGRRSRPTSVGRWSRNTSTPASPSRRPTAAASTSAVAPLSSAATGARGAPRDDASSPVELVSEAALQHLAAVARSLPTSPSPASPATPLTADSIVRSLPPWLLAMALAQCLGEAPPPLPHGDLQEVACALGDEFVAALERTLVGLGGGGGGGGSRAVTPATPVKWVAVSPTGAAVRASVDVDGGGGRGAL